jgi:hypothetical protein
VQAIFIPGKLRLPGPLAENPQRNVILSASEESLYLFRTAQILPYATGLPRRYHA